MTTSEIIDASKIIDALGGTTEASKFCDVSPAAVSQWRTSGIPKRQLKWLKLAKPSLFKAIRAKKPVETAAA